MVENQITFQEIQNLFIEKKFQLALKKIDKILSTNPKNIDLLINKTSILISLEKYHDAEKILKELIFQDSKNFDLRINLGIVYQRIKKYEESKSIYKSLILEFPNNYHATLNLVNLYLELDEPTLALLELQKINSQCKNYDFYHQLLGEVYLRLLDYENALIHHQEAVNQNPKNALNFFLLGVDFMASGENQVAGKYFDKAIQLNPNYVEAYYSLSRIIKYDNKSNFYNDLIDLKKKNSLTDREKSYINFALYNIYERSEEYENAIKVLNEANRQRRSIKKFDEKKYTNLFFRIQKKYDELNLNSSIFQNDEVTPIFIVGMPRSGTTLLEQILSNNDLIFGGGELSLLHEELTNIITHNLSVSNIIDLKKKYFTRIKDITDKKYFIDKLPLNFLWVGYILKIFPNAKVINIKRNGFDTCFSIYKTLFVEGALEFSYSQKDILFFYNIYIKMIEFWSKRIPNFFYDVSYEVLVNNPEEEIREICDYIGLEFKESFLDLKKNTRWVFTASDHQVREKITKKEKSDWSFYKNHLEIFSNFFKH